MSLFSLTEAELRRRTSLKWTTFEPDVLPLWVAEMDVHQLPEVVDAVREALELGDTGYPWGTRYAEAYADMAEARWGWRPAPDQLRRSGDVMNAILSLLLGNTAEGDHVVINPPVYPPFWQVIGGYRRHITQVPLTAAAEARAKVGVSQAVFADMLGVSVRTLQDWEQGRREPSGAARTLLRVAARSPEAVRAAA